MSTQFERSRVAIESCVARGRARLVGAFSAYLAVNNLACRVFAFLLAVQTASIAAAELAPGEVEFFEAKIRPVFVDRCYKCHSTQGGKSKGGLLLDTKAAVLKGGDSGPAIVPGKPDDSLLIKAIRYTDKDLQMPPDAAGGKLPDETIAAFEAWVKAGAPDPRTGPAPTQTGSTLAGLTNARDHWSFKPVCAPPLPAVTNEDWVRTPVDAFILAKLEAQHLSPAPPADKHTLLRRAYFDLIGLPPSPAEMEAFLNDGSEDAFEAVVDRLLDSPRYGERWGRYWLDVARYADTKGYVFVEERRYAFSYTYRDYVIKAFNSDKPFDRFLIEQIAADRLPLGEDKSPLAAMGFLTLGRRFLNNPNDIIDDRIDVVTRGTMGLTVTCARCHDHKFDPIPTADYYSLHGIFASSVEPEEKPLLGKLIESPDYQDFLKKKAEIEAKEEAEIETQVQKFLATARQKSSDYLLAAHDAKQLPLGESLEKFAGLRKLEFKVLQRWIAYLDSRQKSHDPILAPWFAFAALPEMDFESSARALLASFAANHDAAKPINPLIAKALADAPPGSLKGAAAIYGKLLNEADRAWTSILDAEQQKDKTPPPTALPDLDQEAIRQVLYAADAPPNLHSAEVRPLIATEVNNSTLKYRKDIAALDWQHPGAPARAMALFDAPKPHNSKILLRGNPDNPGSEVPRRFLHLFAQPGDQLYTNGSGRLELAQAIASRNNPLTARVFVNRVWGWHFGAPLVRTPSDFGLRSEAPLQQDLLDWLAATFMERGWSVKQLHRLIMLSSTYRQSSDEDPTLAAADPDNRLIGHFNRHRLDFEATRDTLLAASGKLDLAAGGQAVDILDPPFSGRRTVYGFIDRQNLPGLFRTFDFASPDASVPQRFTTTVPQQALFFLNSPFVIEQARQLVNRPEVKSRSADAEKIEALYELLFQRAPEEEELKLAEAFVRHNAAPPEALLTTVGWQYGQGWFDSLTKRIRDFQIMTNFASGRFTPTAAFPATNQFGYLSLTAVGGHPGDTPKLACVRRWIAPADGTVRIDGSLRHPSEQGDGVHGLIVTGRGGKQGEWTVYNRKVETQITRLDVKLGETVDFVVDSNGDSYFDSFTWRPVVSFLDTEDPLVQREWDAKKDFNVKLEKPTPLSPWEQLTQVLLSSNELIFVD